MLDKIIITKETGEVLNMELVSMFSIPQINKQFVITTSNEIDPNGLVKLHVSELKNGKLFKVEIDEDWTAIKTAMRSIISSSAGDHKYIPSIDKVDAMADYTRGIAVQIVAKEQLANDYKAKKPTEIGKPVQPLESDSVSMQPSTPVMTTTDFSVPNGIAVAPGIVETPAPEKEEPIVENASGFEPVNVDENPTDLIIDNNEQAPTEESVVALENITPEVTEEPVDPNLYAKEETKPVLDIDLAAKPEESVVPVQETVKPAEPQNQVPNQMTPDMNMFQQMFNQMMQQMGMNSQVANVGAMPPVAPNFQTQETSPITLTDEEYEKIVADAREVFMESAKNLADVIIANAHDKIKAKMDELARKEIILAQREAAINQQTMVAYQQAVPTNQTENAQ